MTPLYSGDLYDYLHAEGSFGSSLPKNYSIAMDFKLKLFSDFVDAMAGGLPSFHPSLLPFPDLKKKKQFNACIIL